MRLSAGWRATPGFTIRCFRLFIWPISGRAGPAGALRRQRPAFPGHGQPAPGRPDTRQRFGWLPGPTWVASAAHMRSATSAFRRHVGGIMRPGLSGRMRGSSGFAARRRGVASRGWSPPRPLSHLRRVMTGLRRSPEIELISWSLRHRREWRVDIRLAPPIKTRRWPSTGPAIRPSPGERAHASWWFVCGRNAESHR
jgi:hypothetical protein